jgi:predicted RNase H-like nuclease
VKCPFCIYSPDIAHWVVCGANADTGISIQFFSILQKVRQARIRMAKKGATNAFLQHKEDGGLQVSNTHEQMFPYAHIENHSYFMFGFHMYSIQYFT